jgi:hypothetical protein
MPSKVDSNAVGLRYAVEETIGVLPGSPVWKPLEPNSYGDFGGQFSTTARNPISETRQRKKGALTDVEASGSFEMDFLQDAMYDLMPVFMFAAWAEKANEAPSAVTSAHYAVADESLYAAGDLVFAQGFGVSGNNGLKAVTGTAAGELQAAGLAAEASPPADAKITLVGVQAGSGDITITNSGGVVTLGSTTLDFTDYDLVPGEWVFVGGDAAATKFATAADNGWYRIQTVAADALVMDRWPGTVVTDAGTGKTIRLFFGHRINNATAADDIERTTVQLERSFGSGLDNEYITGQVGSEFSMELKTGTDSKIVCNMGFMGLSYETAAAKSGDRPALDSEPCFTSVNDVSRLRLQREDTDATLATYIETFKISLKNNCSYNKAIGVLGAWEITVGDFEVMGEAEAFFGSHDAATAIQQNADVSFDIALVQLNAGWLFDLPLVTLGDARLKVAKDESVKLPLSADATMHETLGYTMRAQYFAYLPDAAE